MYDVAVLKSIWMAKYEHDVASGDNRHVRSDASKRAHLSVWCFRERSSWACC